MSAKCLDYKEIISCLHNFCNFFQKTMYIFQNLVSNIYYYFLNFFIFVLLHPILHSNYSDFLNNDLTLLNNLVKKDCLYLTSAVESFLF